MTEARSGATTVVGPLLAVGATYLFFFAGGYYGIYDARVRVSSLVIAGVVLGLFALAALRSDRWFPRSRIWPALALGVGTLAASAIFSRNPRISADFVAYGVLLAGLYLLLRAVLTGPQLRARLGAAMVILAFAIDVAYLLAVGSWWRDWWQVLGRLSLPPLRPFYEGLTYGNPGLVAALAVLTALSATAHLGLGSSRSRVAVGILWILTVAVVVASGTRGAWVALALTAIVAGAMGLIAARARSGGVGVPQGVAARAGLVVVGIVVIVGLALFGPTIAQRALIGDDGGRISYWSAAIRMFAEAPLAGVGPGMWAPERILHTNPGEIDFYIPHAHNLFMQTAAELGLLGIAAGLVALVIVVRLVWPAIRGGNPEVRRWAVAATLAAVYFGSHQLFDLFVNMPAALFVFAFPIAWLDANADETESTAPVGGARPNGRRLALLGVGVAVVAIGVGWTLLGERSALAQDGAVSALKRGDIAEAVRLAGETVRLDPSIPPGSMVAALAAMQADDSAAAEAALRNVVAADDLPAAWIDLAWLLATNGDLAAAAEALTQGLRLGEQAPAINLAAGRIQEELGDVPAGDELHVAALVGLPRLAAGSYWQEAARAERWPAILETAAAALPPAERVDLYLSAEDVGAARGALAEVTDPASAARLALVIDAWAGDEGARTSLADQAFASPRDYATLAWSARLADRAGDDPAAATFRFLLGMQAPNAGQSGTEVEIVSEVAGDDAVAGANWVPYGIYTYRRPTPGALLLPGLPQIVWAR